MHFGIIEDYEYNVNHKRHRLTLWSGAFASQREGEAYSLPKNDGYMVSLEYGDKVRVTCPAPRDDENYVEVDEAINKALNAHLLGQRLEALREAIESESISYGELEELQSLGEAGLIPEGDLLLREWAGLPEHEEDEDGHDPRDVDRVTEEHDYKFGDWRL